MANESLDLTTPMAWSSEAEREAAVRFFNAAFRAEESGLRQAHELAEEVATWDRDLAEVLRLYGEEEGWHRELLGEFLTHLGDDVRPMGRVTSLFYKAYRRARRMETIVLVNLMFETIGATTYRLALGRVQHEAARRMLTILTRDESFHVPLNAHFLREILARRNGASRRRLSLIYHLLFVSLTALPLFSRPKAQAFDGISTKELSQAYARQLGKLFAQVPDLGLAPPLWLLEALGVREQNLGEHSELLASVEAAERSANRDDVVVTAL
jgi:hypothetical protein